MSESLDNKPSVADVIHEINQSESSEDKAGKQYHSNTFIARKIGTKEENAPMKYSLYVFHINDARNSWVWHFNVTKDLNALVKVRTDNSY